MRVVSLCLIVKYIMVLNILDQTFSQISTCIGNRPWIAPMKRTIDYQNVSTISPIEVIVKPRSAVYPCKHQNGVNHNNLSKITVSSTDSTDVISFLINARSIRANGQAIRHQIEHKKPAIVAITET